ncbi:MAG TPA: PKD domain-containing protein, partial [Candidatus Polarisedimenticolia bacterium]|nr:PKD domain-containing protein [Candidatus Polarisedimenticolia bacterium]
LSFTLVSGPSFVTVTTTTPGTGTGTGNIHLAPGFSDEGTYSVTVRASDGAATNDKTLTVTVTGTNQAPTLNPIAPMTVTEGGTADQVITGSDPDGDPLTFSLVSGPSFVTVTTTNGTTGNVHLAPSVGDAGTYMVTAQASDGSQTDTQSFVVTVNPFVAGNEAPVLAQPSNMTVAEGATADQTLTATDADGDPLTFTLVSGPSFATVTTTTAGTGTGTGNIHLAPGSTDAGTYIAVVRASDGSASNDKSLTITVTDVGGGNQAPVLTQPADMTVTEGQTADQTITATDADGDPLSFTLVTGPTFVTVGTTSAGTGTGTGNIHLAPGFADAGTYNVTVRVSDGTAADEATLLVTVLNQNRAPVADAGGPYSGTVGVAVNFNGTGSTDPDGDALTYTWDFGDGSTGTGATPSHAYTAPGTYTVTLTVSDGSLSDTDTSSANITTTGGLQADASVDGGDRVIRLQSNKPFWCVDLTSEEFQVRDINVASIRLNYNGGSIPSLGTKRLVVNEGDNTVQICFGKDELRTLFSDLGNGRNEVTLTVTGELNGGGSFTASLDVVVQKTGGPNAAKEDHGNPHFRAWASPNPLNPSTVISFALSQPGSVRLNVYDVSGRLVKPLANQFMDAGVHEVRWDGTTRTGSRAASGVYFYVLTSPEGTVKSQLVVAK